MRVLILGLFCAALAACESAPPLASELRPAPADRVFAPPVTSEQPAQVAFIRDAGGSHIRKWRVSVDNKPVAVLDKAEFVVIKVDPGLRQFKVDLNSDDTPKEFVVRIDAHLPPGGSQVYRMGNTSESRMEVYRDTDVKMPG